jgi:hypothetical protein
MEATSSAARLDQIRWTPFALPWRDPTMKAIRRSIGGGSLVLPVLLSACVRTTVEPPREPVPEVAATSASKGRGADDTNCKNDSEAEAYMMVAVVMALQVNPPRMVFIMKTLERHRQDYPQGKFASSREALLKRIGEFQNPQ